MKNQSNPLLAISPVDGRYLGYVEELSQYSSEYAIIKYRLEIEIKYLQMLSKAGVIRKLTKTETKMLISINKNLNVKEAEKIKVIEKTTHHDVKAVEYYLKSKLSGTSLSNLVEYIHFGLTSEDINNLSIRIMLKAAIENIIVNNLVILSDELLIQSKKYKKLIIIARTHGQPAVPTTLGKEFLVFYERLNREIQILKSLRFRGKLNGAVGNYNALYFAYPKVDWPKFSNEFVRSFGFEDNTTTNQIAPFEDIILLFQTIQRINGVILDLNQDMWRYISDNWFIQENKKDEVGSSTMPQKINPILFENSEGNLIIANSLIEGFNNKLPISRLQRDLSNSTISRNFGLCLAYCLIAYKNSFSALLKLKANEEKIKEDLNSDWSVLTEAVQIYLKKNSIKDGYEIIKKLTRGQKLTQQNFINMIDKLPLSIVQKDELKKLTPENYIGIL